jgi:hypothetical protein
MKPSASRIERTLAKVEATLVPPPRKWLRAIIHEGDAEAVVKEKQEKALAEHVARHPEDVGHGPPDRSAALGDLCHEAPARAVTRTSRSSATGSIDNSPGGIFLHW